MEFILVIDDSKQATDALEKMLLLWDLHAKTALNPTGAFSILEKEIPKAIFLDINMPGVDGYEVLGFLKREPRLAGIPVIVITSDDQVQTRSKALSSGATAVLIKPVEADAIEKLLKAVGIL